ncbi:MAG: hypothetical protein AAGK00_13430 [Pseudomonadota bacterium]
MTVTSRHIWYVHGFDPATTARYRRIFQAGLDRYDVTARDLPSDADDAQGWSALRSGVETRVQVLRYEDLVRAYQQSGVFERIGRGIRSFVAMTYGGAWGRLGPRTLALTLAPILAVFLPSTLAAWFSRVGWGWSLGALAVFGLMSAVLLFRYRLILAADLMAYLHELADGAGPAFAAYQARTKELAKALCDPKTQEVLLVGHSLGGMTAIQALAAALPDWPADRAISFLTMGSVHGLVLGQRGAGSDQLA